MPVPVAVITKLGVAQLSSVIGAEIETTGTATSLVMVIELEFEQPLEATVETVYVPGAVIFCVVHDKTPSPTAVKVTEGVVQVIIVEVAFIVNDGICVSTFIN